MKCRLPGPASGLVACLIWLGASGLAAQSVDEGTLLIRAGGREVGTETFRIVSDSESLRITARTTYGARGTEFTSTVERAGTSEAAFQLEWRGGLRGTQLFAVQKRNRITVRRVDKGGEQASELPGAPRTALLADSVFSILYQVVWLAGQNGPVNVLFPQGNRRFVLSVERTTSGQGTLVRLRDGLAGVIELGNRGQVLRIQLSSLGLDAVRKPE